jgi:alanine dehydrogenase
VLVISEEEVESLLDVDRLVDVLARAMADLSGGRASAPSRTAVSVPGERGFLGCMPAYLPAPETLAAKLVSVFPGNRTRPTHQALVCCLDPRSGEPLAVMGGTYLTAARTAAGSVLAARLLARHDAGVVAVIGTGVQARAHARAFRGRGQILVAGRDRRKAEALVDDLAASGVAATATRSIEEAVRWPGSSASPPTPIALSSGGTG